MGMKWAYLLRRWTMRNIHSAILGSALLGSASTAMAQAPGVTASKLPEMHHTRSQTFDLPVQMRPEDRAALSEIRLYVKTANSGWKLQEKGGQDLTRFSCKVTQEGEYWYTLALVDRAGRMTPADVNLEPPSQRVVVDTTPPVIQVEPGNSGGDFCLRCTVQDANPDYATLKAVCTTNIGDIPLETVPNQPGVFRLKGAEMMQFPVVVSVKDLAGNLGTKEVNIREMVGTTISPAPAHKGPTNIVQAAAGVEKVLPPPRADLSPRTEQPAAAKNQGQGVTPQITEFAPPPPLNPPSNPALTQPETLPDVPSKVALTPLEAGNQHSGPHQLINTTHASVEYRIDQVGPSGVGKVEVYMTPDKGQTWHRLGEDADKRSPADINLPGDGVYGIRIVVTNGNGFGGKAPVRGDLPHCTIEVDTTSPFVQMRSTEVMPSSGHVEIRWNATDKNLGTEPVSLSYRTRPDGPWQVIARGLKNDGVHRWAFPRDAGGQFFFKIEVTDLAGNMSQDVSRQPIVIDMTEPRATVVGVTGSGAVRQTSGGN
jgi:hypothetical protein